MVNVIAIATTLNFDLGICASEKAISATELIKRLKILNERLCLVKQEGANVSSFDKVAKQLSASTLIKHKDAGVRVLVACGIAEILRIYAPNAPYSAEGIKTIFALFLRELGFLGDLGNTYRQFHLQLLESLALVRSVALCTELDNSEQIMHNFVKVLFCNVMKEHPQVVKTHTVTILATLIEEVPTILPETIDRILGEIYINNEIAIKLAHTATARLQRELCTVFSSSIASINRKENINRLSGAIKENKVEKICSVETEETLRLHGFLVHIYTQAPALLFNVFPLLEEELSSEIEKLRSLAVGKVGEMLAQIVPQQQDDIIHRCPGLWKAWLARSRDRVVRIRIAWLSCLPSILNKHGATASYAEVGSYLQERFLDQDENVRLHACRIISLMDFKVLQRIITTQLADCLRNRIKDNKSSVRREAIMAVCSLWMGVMNFTLPLKPLTSTLSAIQPKNVSSRAIVGADVSFSNLQDDCLMIPTDENEKLPEEQLVNTNLDESEVQEVMACFGWVPSALLSSVYLNDNELTATLEHILIEKVIKPQGLRFDDWQTKTERLLWFLASAGDDLRVRNIIFSILNQQRVSLMDLESLINVCSKTEKKSSLDENSVMITQSDLQFSEHDNQRKMLVSKISDKLPEVGRGVSAIKAIQKLSDEILSGTNDEAEALRNSIKNIMAWGDGDFRKIRRIGREVLKILEEKCKSEIEIYGILIRRVSPSIICREMIPCLLEKSFSCNSSNTIKSIENGSKIKAAEPPTLFSMRLAQSAEWLLKLSIKIFPVLAINYRNEIFRRLETMPLICSNLLSRIPLSETPLELFTEFAKRLNHQSNCKNIARVFSKLPASKLLPEHIILTRAKVEAEIVAILNHLPIKRIPLYLENRKHADAIHVALTYFYQLSKENINRFERKFGSSIAPKVLAILSYGAKGLTSYDESCGDVEQNPGEIKIQTRFIELAVKIERNRVCQKDKPTNEVIDEAINKVRTLIPLNWDQIPAILASNADELNCFRVAGVAALRITAESKLSGRLASSSSDLLLRLASLVMNPKLLNIRDSLLAEVRHGLLSRKLDGRYAALFCIGPTPETASLNSHIRSCNLLPEDAADALAAGVFLGVRVMHTFKKTGHASTAFLGRFVDALACETNVGILNEMSLQLASFHGKIKHEPSTCDELNENSASVRRLGEQVVTRIRDICRQSSWLISSQNVSEIVIPSDLFFQENMVIKNTEITEFTTPKKPISQNINFTAYKPAQATNFETNSHESNKIEDKNNGDVKKPTEINFTRPSPLSF